METCDLCNHNYDDNDDCECPPEGYVKPGQEALLYVNAYRLTRHYGGSEEGGWWYNNHEPLASIPVKGISVDKHECCYNCNHHGEVRGDGTIISKCKWAFHIEANDPNQVEKFKKHLKEIYEDEIYGNIYSVLGGVEVCICVEGHVAESNEPPRYE